MDTRLPAVGDQVAGRYRIQKQLGSGGFGVVFHARQESMGRDVAIKFLSPDVSNDPVAVERFRREAYYSSGLRHPNTIVIHDYGQTDDKLFYIVMELLEGEPLSKAIFAGGGLTLGRTLRIGEQILRSLGEAHQKGLVHRDLKPENIFLVDLLGERDFVKVLDFGLSKALTPDNPALTQEGVVFGTPLYMAPEQAYGEDVLPASDLFAFGLLLYEMLLGERPFRGRTSMEVLLKLTQEPLPRLPEPLAGTPVQVYIDRLTEKEPQNRFTNASEALPDLQKMMRGVEMVQLGDLDQVYVGARAKAQFKPPPDPFAQVPTPPKLELPPPVGNGPSLTSAKDIGSRSSAPASPAKIVGAQDILGDLFAPEELAASARQVARAESIASGNIKALGETEAPGAVSINMDVARESQNRQRRRYQHAGAKTIITTVDVSEDQRPGSHTLSELSFDTPLIGRQEDLNRLDQRGVKALKGTGGLVIVEGDSGVGKTRLVEEFKKMMVRRGAAVFTGVYQENAIGPGTGLRRAIEQLLRIEGQADEEAQKTVARRLKKLDIDSPELVGMLMRALRPGLAQGENNSMIARTTAPIAFRVLERMLIREARKRPIVLLIEDLHWADPFTLGFAEYLVTHLSRSVNVDVDSDNERLIQGAEALPLLVVCTLRKGQLTEKATLVGAVQRMGKNLGRSFVRLELDPLDHRGSKQLMGYILPLLPDLRQKIYLNSGGNPLYILQALRYLATGRMMVFEGAHWRLQPGIDTSLPSTLPELLRRRIEQAVRQDPERELLGEVVRLSSVLGVKFSHRLLESFFVNLGRPELIRKLNRVLEGLVHAELLRRTKSDDGAIAYEFVHALVQETLVTWLTGDPSVSSYHEAAARAKEVAGDKSLTRSMSWQADVARHWEEAGEVERAIEFRLRSARAAEKSLDLETARTLYRRVEDDLNRDGISNSLRANVQLRLGAINIRLGALGPAEDMLRRGAETARQIQNERAEGRAMTLMGRVFTLQSRHREALRCFRRATACLGRLQSTEPSDVASMAEAQLGQAEVARLRGELSTAESVLGEALTKARQVGAIEIEAHCLHNLGRIAQLCGRLGEAQKLMQDAGKGFDRSGLVIASASAAADRGLVQLYTTGRRKAEKTVRAALDILEASGDQILTAHARVILGVVLRRGDDLEAASNVANQALSVFNQLQHIYGIARATLLLGEIVFLKGDAGLAQNLGTQALQLHEKIGDAHGMALSLMFLGHFAVERGDLDHGEAQLMHAISMFEKGGIILYRPACQLNLGRIAQARGQVDRAQELFTKAYQESRTSNNRETECRSALLLGTLSLVNGHLGKARGFLQTGLNVARTMHLDEALILLLFGQAWVETLAGNKDERQRFVDEVAALKRRTTGRDFYLRERVKTVAQAVSRIRGLTEADHYRRAALTVLQQM